MAASSLVVADGISRLPELIQNLQARLLDNSEPLLFSGLQITSSVENKLPAGEPLPVFSRSTVRLQRGISVSEGRATHRPT